MLVHDCKCDTPTLAHALTHTQFSQVWSSPEFIKELVACGSGRSGRNNLNLYVQAGPLQMSKGGWLPMVTSPCCRWSPLHAAIADGHLSMLPLPMVTSPCCRWSPLHAAIADGHLSRFPPSLARDLMCASNAHFMRDLCFECTLYA
jgi:hypothetical protein